MKVFVGDPTRVRCPAGSDISTATALAITGRRPDGSTFTWPGTLSGTTDVVYDDPSSRWTAAGTWRLWTLVTMPGREAPFHGEPYVFTVYEPGS